MATRILLSPPDVGQAEEDALLRALRSGWVAPLGPEVDGFEAELATTTGRLHAIALSSGTAALHLALLGCGVAPETVVITSTMTFAATANAIAYTGAEPIFVDCDTSGNMDPGLLEVAIRTELARGSRISAILPVDLLGKVADYNAIGSVAGQHGIPVISDAAESLGAVRNGKPAGSAGIASAISFNGNKIITTSGGGALVTDDADLAANTRYLATQARQPVAHYEHHHIGFNYRLSNLLAGIGRAQLSRLPAMLERRKSWRIAYRELAETIPGVEVFGGPDGSDAISATADHDNFWLTSLLVDEATSGWSAHSLRNHLTSKNIEARPLWKPMHQQPVFAAHRRYLSGLSDVYFERGISLPSGSALTNSEFEFVVATIDDFARNPK